MSGLGLVNPYWVYPLNWIAMQSFRLYSLSLFSLPLAPLLGIGLYQHAIVPLGFHLI